MILKIKPDQNCKACYGQGELYDSVPYGSTNVSMFSGFCDCVLEQIPEDDDDSEIELIFDDNFVECPICLGYNKECLTCKGKGEVTKEKYQEMLSCLPETRED